MLLLLFLAVVGQLVHDDASTDQTLVDEAWNRLDDERRAFVCWGRDGVEDGGQSAGAAVTRQILEERCPAGETVTVQASRPFSDDVEEEMLDNLLLVYKSSPPTADELGATDAQLVAFCNVMPEDVEDLSADEWLAMPWNGVAYVPSDEFVRQVMEMLLEVLCS